MDDVTPIRYASAVGANIAYRVIGDGPLDLVWVPGLASNLEIDFEYPAFVRLMRRLASFSRLMVFDNRGMGLSDRTWGRRRSRSGRTTSVRSWTRWARTERR